MNADSRRPELTAQQVAALADRDPAALTAAYEALADPLFRYLRGRCEHDELAADMVEATFVELIETAPALQGGAEGLRRWMFTAARHNLLDEQRKQARRGDVALRVVDDAEADSRAVGDYAELATHRRGQPGHADPAATPDERYAAAERDAQVRRALATLPDDQREVLELRFAGELSAAAVGAVMERSPGAVRILQHRALKALAKALGERHPDLPDEQTAPGADRVGGHPTSGRPRDPPGRPL